MVAKSHVYIYVYIYLYNNFVHNIKVSVMLKSHFDNSIFNLFPPYSLKLNQGHVNYQA